MRLEYHSIKSRERNEGDLASSRLVNSGKIAGVRPTLSVLSGEQSSLSVKTDVQVFF